MFGRMKTEKLPDTSLFMVYRPYHYIERSESQFKALPSDKSSILDEETEYEEKNNRQPLIDESRNLSADEQNDRSYIEVYQKHLQKYKSVN